MFYFSAFRMLLTFINRTKTGHRCASFLLVKSNTGG